MAKSHLRDLARLLAGKYEEVNKELEQVGLSLSDTMMSPDEQEEFSRLKGLVDASLNTLTVALSAAAQGKIDDVILQLKDEQMAYAEPLKAAIDNMADAKDMPREVKDQTAALITSYNNKIRQTEEIISSLRVIRYWANFVASRKKQRKYFKEVFCKDCARGLPACAEPVVNISLEVQKENAYSCFSIFKQVDEYLNMFKGYVSSLSESQRTDAQVGDMDE